MKKESQEKLERVHQIAFTMDYGSAEERCVALYDSTMVTEEEAVKFIHSGVEYSPKIVIMSAEQAKNVFGINAEETDQ